MLRQEPSYLLPDQRRCCRRRQTLPWRPSLQRRTIAPPTSARCSSSVLTDMKDFIGTKNDVLVLACSGTGVMEPRLEPTRGDKFWSQREVGERWTGLAKLIGCNVSVPPSLMAKRRAEDIRAKLRPRCAQSLAGDREFTGARPTFEASQRVREHDDTLPEVRCHPLASHHAPRVDGGRGCDYRFAEALMIPLAGIRA